MPDVTSNLAANGADHPFVHLRVHSAYSILEGAIQIPELTELCRQNHMPAVAITDSTNLYAALEFATKLSAEGIQPIIGCAVSVVPEKANLARFEQPGQRPYRAPALVFLAQSEAGYQNLLNLVSGSFDDTESAYPYATLASVAENSDDLICLTGGPYGLVGYSVREQRPEQTKELVAKLAEIFPGRLYMELQRHGPGNPKHAESEAGTEQRFLHLAYDPDLQLPLVATNEVYFPSRDFFDAHGTLLNINPKMHGVPCEGRITEEHCFKSGAEMSALFDDLPEALDNTIEIAQRCTFWPSKRDPMLPAFTTDDNNDEVTLLRDEAHAGLRRRLEHSQTTVPEQEYFDRLDFELSVITEMNFAGYFLIVSDFVGWAKDRQIPVGPGRGSGAGSLVAYALRITDLDPLQYGLLFERFLNPERISMPDFDIDFCEDRREEVLQYVRERWGAEKVAKIITFGSMQARAAIRDVGRALGVPLPVCDRIAKTIPYNPANPISLAEAMESVPEFKEEIARESEGQKLFAIASQLEGLPRNASIHAAGIVIGNRPLRELVPLWQDSNTEYPATQFSMGWAEAAGLVKFDFLGLKTLTALQETVDNLRKRGVDIDLSSIPLDDPGVFELLSKAETAGVFQVEGDGMRDMLRQLQPDRFEDIIALVALYRPGPMDNIPLYCAIKHGKEQATYLHPKLEPILSETYGIIVYQEQVMEIARQLAGYSLGDADVLRRAMGKKKPEEMKRMEATFLKGLKEQSGLDGKDAKEIFELVAKFAEYGFNKSHAAAYALISYQTAYLKVHYPAEFLAAIMNTELYGQDRDKKLAKLRNEAIALGVPVPPPCVNRSFARFQAVPDESAERGYQIPYALGAIKGVSNHTVDIVDKARAADGPFETVGDFARRVALKDLGKKAVEGLGRAGALDAVDPNRRRVVESVPTLLQYSFDHHREGGGTCDSLFGDEGLAATEPMLADVSEYKPMEQYQEERAAIGFLVSGHPLDEYTKDLEERGIRTCSELETKRVLGEGILVVGAVDSVKRKRSKNGNLFAQITVSDSIGSCSMFMFSDTLAQCGSLMEEGQVLALTVDVGEDQRGRSTICKQAHPLAKMLHLIKPRSGGASTTDAPARPSAPPAAAAAPRAGNGHSPSQAPAVDCTESEAEATSSEVLHIQLDAANANTAPQELMAVFLEAEDATDGMAGARVQITIQIVQPGAVEDQVGTLPDPYMVTDQTLDRIRHVAGVLSAELTKGTVH